MKKGFHQVLILGIVGFALGSVVVNCQETPLDSSQPNVTNASSTIQTTTCTENNGKSCPEWLHKLIGQYPPLHDEGEYLESDQRSIHFWTYRGSQEAPLRTNREVFHSKIFMASHIGGAIAMFVATRTKNSGESLGGGTAAVATLFVMDYIQFRFVGGPNAVAAPICEMIHYGLASAR